MRRVMQMVLVTIVVIFVALAPHTPAAASTAVSQETVAPIVIENPCNGELLIGSFTVGLNYHINTNDSSAHYMIHIEVRGKFTSDVGNTYVFVRTNTAQFTQPTAVVSEGWPQPMDMFQLPFQTTTVNASGHGPAFSWQSTDLVFVPASGWDNDVWYVYPGDDLQVVCGK